MKHLLTAAALAAAMIASHAPAPACDFCGSVDVSPSMSLKSSDTAVVAEIVGRKLVFAGDAAARTAITFKSLSSISGDAVKPGVTFVSTTPLKLGPEIKRAVVMATVTGTAVNVLDAYPDPNGRLAEYLGKTLALPKDDIAARVGFFARFLEDEDVNISADAQGMFYSISTDDVRKAASALPADDLRAWLKNDKVAVSKKGLYGMLLGMCGKPSDAEILRASLSSVQDNYMAAGGVLAGLALLSGKPLETLTPILKDATKPISVRRAALNVVRFLYDKVDAATKPQLPDLFRVGMADKKTAEFAVEEMARAQEFTLIEDVKKLWLDPARSTQNVRIFIRFYGAVMPDDKRGDFVKWLDANPAPKPPAED